MLLLYAYVWGVCLQACPFVQPCHFDKVDRRCLKCYFKFIFCDVNVYRDLSGR